MSRLSQMTSSRAWSIGLLRRMPPRGSRSRASQAIQVRRGSTARSRSYCRRRTRHYTGRHLSRTMSPISTLSAWVLRWPSTTCAYEKIFIRTTLVVHSNPQTRHSDRAMHFLGGIFPVEPCYTSNTFMSDSCTTLT